MSGSAKYHPKTRFEAFIHELEETFIAVLLGLMTLVTFANVVARYVFNSTLIWGLETTLVLFAWLVLFGISYAFKITAHLGVDAILNIVSSKTRRIMVLIAIVCCIAYAMLLLKGAWDYWAPFGGFEKTTGRWFPLGLDGSTRDQAWYETEQIPMFDWLRFIEPIFNEGEAYEKMPRFIPYIILPFGCALILFRVIQAGIRVLKGQADSLIVSHEAEDAVEEIAAKNREE
ncbi:MAG TPA: TRAP transporter small permease [Paracoccaceae bacterium]|nr:TRAP transporter small permease [Paracoccaceae bacterium]